jgi:hypothetical protein
VLLVILCVLSIFDALYISYRKSVSDFPLLVIKGKLLPLS